MVLLIFFHDKQLKIHGKLDLNILSTCFKMYTLWLYIFIFIPIKIPALFFKYILIKIPLVFFILIKILLKFLF